jgi:hypothetical protein
MLYTIIHTPDFINSDDFTWDKAYALVEDKLDHKYTVYDGTFCKDIERFKMAYNECPTLVPIEGYAALTTGQLFLLLDNSLQNQTMPQLCYCHTESDIEEMAAQKEEYHRLYPSDPYSDGDYTEDYE